MLSSPRTCCILQTVLTPSDSLKTLTCNQACTCMSDYCMLWAAAVTDLAGNSALPAVVSVGFPASQPEVHSWH